MSIETVQILRTNGPPVLMRLADWKQVFLEKEDLGGEIVQLSVWNGSGLYAHTAFAYLSLVEMIKPEIGDKHQKCQLVFGQIVDLSSYSLEKVFAPCVEQCATMSKSLLRRALQAMAGKYYATLPANLPVLERPELTRRLLTPSEILQTEEGYAVFNHDDFANPVAFTLEGYFYDAQTGVHCPGATHPMNVAEPGWAMVDRKRWGRHVRKAQASEKHPALEG